jgi:hypothetical protein
LYEEIVFPGFTARFLLLFRRSAEEKKRPIETENAFEPKKRSRFQ